MTKPLPYGCIKKQKNIPTLKQFNFILQKLSIDDNVGHLFVVDIKFDEKAANKKTLLFNENYTPLFKKRKLVKPYERSIIQLLSVLVKNKKDQLNSFKFNE